MKKSGPQGMSAKNIKNVKMKSTGGSQTATALENIEAVEMNNSIERKERIVKTVIVGVIIVIIGLCIEYKLFIGN